MALCEKETNTEAVFSSSLSMKWIEVGAQNVGRANLRLIDPILQTIARSSLLKINEWFCGTRKTIIIKNLNQSAMVLIKQR